MVGKTSYKRLMQAAATLVSSGGLSSAGTYVRSRFPGKKPGGGGKTKFKRGRSLKSKGRLRLKAPQSFTATMTKKRKVVRKVLSGHNDMTTHSFPLKPLGTKQVKSMGTFRYAEQRQAVVEQNVPGRQLVVDAQGWCTRQQLNGTTTTLERRDGLTWSINPYQLNPFVAVPTSTLYPGVQPGVVDGDKIHVASANYRLDLLNMSNIPADVEILFLVSNRDQTNSPTQAWTKCIEEEQLNQVTPVASTSDSNFTGGVGFRQIDNVGNHPMQYASFKKYWRMIGQYKVVLQPGNQHSMKSRIHWHKTFTKKVLDTYDPDITYLKGVSVMPMVIANGGLVGVISEASSSNPSKEVVNGPVKLGWKQELEYIFKALPVQRLKTQRVFEGLMEPTGAYTLKIIDDQDDVSFVEES